jgi:hypothetical protein
MSKLTLLTMPLCASVLFLDGCVSPYVIEPTAAHFPPTSSAVQVVETAPAASCVAVGSFRGWESRACPAGEVFCVLKKLARQHGADTIWIERVDRTEYVGEWKMIRGQLVHLRPFTTRTDTGRLLRCDGAVKRP